MKKKLAAILLAASIATALAGCSSISDQPAGASSSSLLERTVGLTDGRTVVCVVYKDGYRGGLSCDWDGAAQ